MSMMSTSAAQVNTGPVGRDDPAKAFRQDRLIVATLGKMSEGQLLDFVALWGEQPGAWAEYITEVAVARLERDFGYRAVEVDEGRLAELAAGGE